MSRENIYIDGIKTQFSKENQPKNKGRKKGQISFKAILNKYLEKDVELENPLEDNLKSVKSTREHLCLRLLARALNGDRKAINDIINRTDGKPELDLKLNGSITIIEQIKELSNKDLEKLMEMFQNANK